MRALLRTVTGGGSPRPPKANAPRYTVSDVVAAWAAIKGTLEHAQSGKDAAAQAHKKGKQQQQQPSQDEQAALLSLTKNITVLVDALVSEASVFAFEESTGPCFEYLLTNDVLTTLVALVLPDRPAGLLGVLIKAFDTLVALLGDDFVALASRPLSRLLKGCFEAPTRPMEQHAQAQAQAHVKDGSDGSSATASSTSMDRLPSSNYRADAYDAQLAGLLCGICSRIKAHPDLLPIFFLEKRTASNSSTGKVSRPPAKVLTVLKSPTPSSRSSATRSSVGVADDSFVSLAATSPPSAGRSTDTPHEASAQSKPATHSSSVEALARGYNLPLLAYLLKYLHRDGRAGEFARAGVLFLVDLAMSPLSSDHGDTGERQRQRGNGTSASPSATKGKPDLRPTLGRRVFSASSTRSTSRLSVNGDGIPLTTILATYLASSDLADVLGAGLGALYGLLPAKLHIPARPDAAVSGLSKPESEMPSANAGDASDVFDAATQDALDDEERLHSLRDDGYAILGDADFAEQLKGWSKLVEFGQDVVRRAQSSVDGHTLAERSLASIRTAFLENAFLPCISECQHIPSHLAAVLVHVETLLDILEAEGGLADCVLSFLLDTPAPFELFPSAPVVASGMSLRPEESMTTPSRPLGSIAMDRLASSSHSRATSISDSGKSRLLVLSDARHGAGSAGMSLSGSRQSAPDSTSRGRAITHTQQRLAFTLRDMLDQAMAVSARATPPHDADIQSEGGTWPPAKESGEAVADLALRIVHLLLAKFDYWGTELLGGVTALGATRFPFDMSATSSIQTSVEDGLDEEESFVYPASDDDAASTADSFVYPDGPGAPPTAIPAAETKATQDAWHRPSGPSELEILLRLTSTSKENGQADSPLSAQFDTLGADASASTGYESYLIDAEAAVLRDPSFRRGLSIRSAAEHLEEAGSAADLAARGFFSPPLHSPSGPSTSTGSYFATTASRPSGQEPVLDRMSQHYLPSPFSRLQDHRDPASQRSVLLQAIHLFARFFANPPETNLALSAIWSAMASCPYRSLQGWLLPSAHALSRLAEAGLIPVSPTVGLATKSSDLASSDLRPFDIFQLVLQSSTDSAKENVLSLEEASVFAILERLIGQVERYRREIKAFDRHLRERREGLLFIDDLAEAIGGGAPDGETPRPSFTASRSSSNFATASPLKRPSGASVSTTPVRVKKGSKGSLLGSRHDFAQKSEQAVLSPYASHYAQTSEMRVKAWVVPLPADAQSPADPITPGWVQSSTLVSIASHRFDEGPETPTRQSTFARPGKRAGMLAMSDRNGEASTTRMRVDAVEISLSQLLDNVIILEEMVKELVALVVVRKRLGIDEV